MIFKSIWPIRLILLKKDIYLILLSGYRFATITKTLFTSVYFFLLCRYCSWCCFYARFRNPLCITWWVRFWSCLGSQVNYEVIEPKACCLYICSWVSWELPSVPWNKNHNHTEIIAHLSIISIFSFWLSALPLLSLIPLGFVFFFFFPLVVPNTCLVLNDSSIRLWALTGEVLMEMVGHTSIVYSVDSHVSGLIVSASEDCLAKIWKG